MAQSAQSALGQKGDKWETSDKERSGRQLYNHAAQSTQSAPEDKSETSVLVDNCNIMRPKQSQCGRNASPVTTVKSCGPGTQPFQRSKNPSQVNRFGEIQLLVPYTQLLPPHHCIVNLPRCEVSLAKNGAL